MTDFNGKIALVTGGGKGVGAVISKSLAARGAHVLINCFHSYDKAKGTLAEIRSAGGRADILRASVAKADQVDRMFQEVESRFGGIDVLVNNAASGAFLPMDGVVEEAFDRALDTNLKGAFWCARRAAAMMSRRGGGTIVNLSSVGANGVPSNYVVVGTSKAAVESLTRYLAVEYGRWNVRVNTASGGMLDNEVARLFPRHAEMREAAMRATPLGRLGTEKDLADLVLFLASEQSRFITGQTVLADGGLCLGGALMAAPGDFKTAAPAAPEAAAAQEIAVVGMGLVAPGAENPDAFWKLLTEGSPVFGYPPEDRWDWRPFHSDDPSAEDKTYQSRFGFIRDFRPDPALALPRPDGAPEELSTTWLRHALAQALKGVHRREDDRFSFLVGYTPDGSQSLEEAMVLDGALRRMGAALSALPGGDAEKAVLSSRIQAGLRRRYRRGLSDAGRFLPHRVALEAMRGLLPESTEAWTVDTACSSSLYSLDLAVKGLLEGKQDVAVCGGAYALSPRDFVLFSKLKGLSMSGDVRALDRKSDGVLFSDGAGVLVLKTLARARADGDRVLGLVRATGCSCDGKGKAIYAPSAEGQSIAVRRSHAAGGTAPDWVVAHATGTPAGDKAEFSSLKETLSGEKPVRVTSNKSLVGHMGWAAGVASLVQVLLAMREGRIPPQRRFEAVPDDFGADTSTLSVPKEPVPWTAPLRRAAVSGFGFGGTNAHVVLEADGPVREPAPRRARREGRVAVVGWSAHVPGLTSRAEVAAWLKGEGPAPTHTFGPSYPLPPFERVKLPPALMRAVDRCQLMALACGQELKDALGPSWEKFRDRAGVLLGHMGPTRAAVHYGARVFLDDVKGALTEAGAWSSPLMAPVWEAYASEVKSAIPAANENAFPGLMPNVIPARIANAFDLKGLNATVDAGFASSLAAFESAARYLRNGDLDLAIAGGINGNTTPEMEMFVSSLLGTTDARPAEGSFLLALAMEETALAEGLPVLGFLGDVSRGNRPEGLSCGASDRTANYLGGAGAKAAIQALLTGRPGVTCRGEAGAPDLFLPVSPLTPIPQLEAGSDGKTGLTVPPADALPSLEVRRHVVRWLPRDDAPIRQATGFLVPGAVVLTDRPSLLSGLQLPPGVTVLSTVPGAGAVHLPSLTPEAVAAAVPAGTRHLRVLADLGASSPPENCLWTEPSSLMALHDLVFLSTKNIFKALGSGGTFVSLFLDAVSSGTAHPFAGLFTGFAKCAALELPEALVFTVATDRKDPAAGMREAAAESRLPQRIPAALYEGGVRKTPALLQEDGAPASPALAPGSVVVALGGGRGITAELMTAVAERYKPILYLLGSNRLEGLPEDVFAGSDEDFLRSRPRYIKDGLSAGGGKTPGELNRAFDRLLDARAVRRNMARMAAHAGSSNVHYIACDARDPGAVERAISRVRKEAGRIDIVVNAAGINRSAAIPAKNLEDFRAVRDIKVKAYQNLRRALKDHPPRLWCHFSSFIGATGVPGETDYASGNDFLGSASLFSTSSGGAEEFSIGWTLWKSAGMGQNPLTRQFLERSGAFTPMTTETGKALFLKELAGKRDPFVTHLGEAERAGLLRRSPDLFDAPPARADFYLGRELSRSKEEVLFERIFGLEKDGYLAHHVVNGHATLPGTFVTEIAAEAAMALLPGMQVTGFEKAVFHHFLRVYGPGKASAKRIRARVSSRSGGNASVDVRVMTDVTAPNGSVLVKDKLHFEIVVRLSEVPPPAPRWEPWDDAGSVPVPDPYHFPSAPVLLTDLFVSTAATRAHPRGKRAEFAPRIPAGHQAFSRFAMPVVLMDGLARTAMLEVLDGELIALAAPASIGRIDIYAPMNDLALASAGPVQLYATPSRIDLEDPSCRTRLTAVLPDGRVLLEMSDVRGVVLGYVNRRTGAFVPRPAQTLRA